MFSNTELVLEYAPFGGAIQIMKVLSYDIEPDICIELRDRIIDIPHVHNALSVYHKSLRIAYTMIEDSDMDNAWRDDKFSELKALASDVLEQEMKKYPWVDTNFADRAYHE